ncbi:MAG: AI-2E family transporter [Anaerolineales bacterium]|nr:AI-2E family transporter [Anaerolineales bacterium]
MKHVSPPQWSLPFRYALGIIIFVLVFAFLMYARNAVTMLIIAGFIAYLISPAVSFVKEKTGWSRKAAVNTVYFTTLILLIGAPATLTPIFFNEIKLVAHDVLELSRDFGEFLSKPIHIGGMAFHFEQTGENLAHIQDGILTPLPEKMLRVLEATSVNAIWALIVLASVHLFMSEWPQISEWLIRLAPNAHQDDMRELYSRLRNIWMAYLRGQLLLMLVVGAAFTIAWMVIGIPGALVLGGLAGLFTLVPDVGPLLAAAIAIGVALLEGSTWIRLSPNPLTNKAIVAGITLIVYLILINLKNFFIRPIIMGRSLRMNESLIFIAILMATILWGILGALLVVPMMASVAVVMEYLRRRILGLPSFAENEKNPFEANPAEIKRRSIKLPVKDKKKKSR